MGTRATPTTIKLIRGADKQHPERFRDVRDEPVPEAEIGDPPKSLKAAQQRIWHEFVEIIPAGVLGNTDRPTLEMACKLMYEFRTNDDMQSAKSGQLIKLLGELGMSPAARAKIRLPAKQEKNPFAE